MERERLAPLVVALLAVLALAVGAATLDDTMSGSVAGGGEGPGIDDGDNQDMDFGAPAPSSDEPRDPIIPPWLAQLLVALVFLGGLIGLLVWIKQDGLDAVKTIALTVFVLTGIILFVYYFLDGILSAFGSGEGGLLGEVGFQLPSGGGGGEGGTGEVTQVATDPSTVLLAVFAVVLVGAVAVVLARSTGETTDEESPDADPAAEPDPSVQAVGDAAGRAADRIDESGDVENAIYRAWREMTSPLDLPRETTTPGEFAAAAVDAGMSRDDVSELTRLFETTRYGGRAVDESREERATTALRRIERTYGGER